MVAPLSPFTLSIGFLVTVLVVAGHDIPAFYRVNQLKTADPACTAENAPENHFVYCSGRLLQAAQALSLYPDSKTFVDKPMKRSPTEVMADFERLFPSDDVITREALQKFVDDNFHPTSTELNECQLTDWTPEPVKLAKIQDEQHRDWALKLNGIWRQLCRQMDDKVKENPERYSLIYVPEPFVVPGGRFREFYYWDSYWTIKGLLSSGMHDTVRRMLINFVSVIERYGMIPNGGRVYYLSRSQPPLLTGMFYEYYMVTGDRDFIKQHIATLEKELDFWRSQRTVQVNLKTGQSYTMYQFRANSSAPRPESFREDVELTKQLSDNKDKTRVWRDLATAAESGWDFSSRWFADGMNMKTIETTHIVEVDLNAFICWNMNILSFFHRRVLEQDDKADEYGQMLRRHQRAFRDVFFVDEADETGWFDFNLRTHEHNFRFYPSSITPLFTQCFEDLDDRTARRIYQSLDKKGAFDHEGIPTSLIKNTNQQWDFPNGWAPLNHMTILGFYNSNSPLLKRAGIEIGRKWLENNYRVFNSTNVMWEKYDVVSGDKDPGTGGEYDVQAGFGWTNGVVLDLITMLDAEMHGAEDAKKFEENVQRDQPVLKLNAHHRQNAASRFSPASALATVVAVLLMRSQ